MSEVAQARVLSIGGNFADWSTDALRTVAQAADEGTVDWIVLPDDIPPPEGGTGWPDALILAGWLIGLTTQVKFLGAVSTLGHQPYNLARRLVSLDLASNGRIGWLVTAADEASARAAFSGHIRLEGVDLAAREAEFLATVEGLFESWDADALALDKESAQFFRPDAMHKLDHRGAHFSVAGPLNVMRSPRGRPSVLRSSDLGSMAHAATPAEALALIAGRAP